MKITPCLLLPILCGIAPLLPMQGAAAAAPAYQELVDKMYESFKEGGGEGVLNEEELLNSEDSEDAYGQLETYCRNSENQQEDNPVHVEEVRSYLASEYGSDQAFIETLASLLDIEIKIPSFSNDLLNPTLPPSDEGAPIIHSGEYNSPLLTNGTTAPIATSPSHGEHSPSTAMTERSHHPTGSMGPPPAAISKLLSHLASKVGFWYQNSCRGDQESGKRIQVITDLIAEAKTAINHVTRKGDTALTMLVSKGWFRKSTPFIKYILQCDNLDLTVADQGARLLSTLIGAKDRQAHTLAKEIIFQLQDVSPYMVKAALKNNGLWALFVDDLKAKEYPAEEIVAQYIPLLPQDGEGETPYFDLITNYSPFGIAVVHGAGLASLDHLARCISPATIAADRATFERQHPWVLQGTPSQGDPNIISQYSSLCTYAQGGLPSPERRDSISRPVLRTGAHPTNPPYSEEVSQKFIKLINEQVKVWKKKKRKGACIALDALQRLLEEGADINYCDGEGDTPLTRLATGYCKRANPLIDSILSNPGMDLDLYSQGERAVKALAQNQKHKREAAKMAKKIIAIMTSRPLEEVSQREILIHRSQEEICKNFERALRFQAWSMDKVTMYMELIEPEYRNRRHSNFHLEQLTRGDLIKDANPPMDTEVSFFGAALLYKFSHLDPPRDKEDDMTKNNLILTQLRSYLSPAAVARDKEVISRLWGLPSYKRIYFKNRHYEPPGERCSPSLAEIEASFQAWKAEGHQPPIMQYFDSFPLHQA